MQHLIVNADDFGISREVNYAICKCFQRRIISSTTLMVNMPYTEDAVRLAKICGFEDRVGIHLNLTSGYPLTMPIRRCPRFCDRKGRFNAAFEKNTWTRLFISRKEAQAVREEIEAQLRRYIEFGLADHHLDSHHHVHTDRSIWKVLSPLIPKYNIRSVRLTRNLYGKISLPKAIYKYWYNRTLSRSGVKTTDYFGSYKDFRKRADRLPRQKLTEIMVHPTVDSRGNLVDGKISMEKEKAFFDSLNAVYEFY